MPQESGQHKKDDPFDQLVDASKAATDAAAKAVGSIDFEGIGDALSRAVKDVTDVIMPKQPVTSPYIIEDKSAPSRGLVKAASGAFAAFVGFWVVIGCGINALAFMSLLYAVFAALGILLFVWGARFARAGLEEREVARVLRRVSHTVQARAAVYLDEVAGCLGMAVPKLTVLVQKGIDKGLVPQGRIARVNGRRALYLTDEAYRAHEEASEAGRRRREAAAAAAQAAQAEETTDARLSEEARRTVAACESFGNTVGTVAPDLLNPRMRSLALELAQKVDTVADRVRRDPSLAGGLSRYESYYLPTAANMLKKAAELDREGAVGGNADATRAEVTDTLELLSRATTKLLDDLLTSTVWDVSSDAGVMRTMLKQDGLADDDLRKDAS